MFSRSILRTLTRATATTTTPTYSRAMSTSAFFDAIKERRTYYNLTNKSTISDEKLRELVETAVKHVPSSYNTQTSRVVIVLGEKNKQLWDELYVPHAASLPNDELRAVFKDKFDNNYSNGYGTVLYFEDQDAVAAFTKNMPELKDILPTFADKTSAMLQFVVWTALATEGIGASLQHYPLFGPGHADAIKKFVNAPEAWKPTAMMPFGVPSDKNAPGVPAFPKTFAPLEDRVKVVQ